ncbi:MAG: laccase domain-containing protein [Candidatus Dormibacteraeota bacterium]|nr:laccase domain-containing protein [Candidatus Dormibacteraeota bacterium]MBO0760602.1 laccase domain-containing protein [Candidatus Dormibacteraeota bacterium]
MSDVLGIDGLTAEAGLVHGFSTLAHGSMRRPDGAPVVTPERRAFAERLGVEAERLTTAGAVHGTRLAQVDEPAGGVPNVDGLLTDRPGLPLFATFGDCCPLVLYDSKRRALALCHAGRRGTARGIATRAVEALRDAYGCQPADLVVGIGPSVCQRCYEVDDEVAAQFDGAGLLPAGPGRWLLDVGEVNRSQFVAAGVRPERIHRHAACTRETPTLPSHRRDHDGRRFACVAALR